MFRKLEPAASAGRISVQAYPADMPGPLVIALLDADLERDGRATAVLVDGFAFAHDGDEVRVPAGYVTDFASIPLLLRWLIQPFGRHARAPVLHDWLYALGEPGRRDFADLMLLRAMEELKVTRVQRSLIYRGVRMFGAGAYGCGDDYDGSWADWRTGDAIKPAHAREDFYSGRWPDGASLEGSV